MQRVELIQELKFETATTRIKATPDGEYLIASGAFHLVFLSEIVSSVLFTRKPFH